MLPVASSCVPAKGKWTQRVASKVGNTVQHSRYEPVSYVHVWIVHGIFDFGGIFVYSTVPLLSPVPSSPNDTINRTKSNTEEQL